MTARAFYRGINFPFQKGSTALPKPVTDADLVKQSLQQIILTGRYQRVMRPDFGCNALSFVFENNTTLLSELIRTEVASAVGRFEPRVILQNIIVERDVDAGKVYVTLEYILLSTKQPDSVTVDLPAGGSMGGT